MSLCTAPPLGMSIVAPVYSVSRARTIISGDSSLMHVFHQAGGWPSFATFQALMDNTQLSFRRGVLELHGFVSRGSG